MTVLKKRIAYRFPPAPVCPSPLARALRQEAVSGIHTHSAIRTPFMFTNGVAVATSDAHVYCVGGYSPAEGFMTEVLRAPIIAQHTIGDWVRCPSLPVALSSGGAVVHNGRLHVFGGTTTRGYSSEIWTSAILSDGLLGGWRSDVGMPERLTNVRVISKGDWVHVLSATGLSGVVYSAKDIRSEKTVQWRRSAPFPHYPSDPQVLELQDRVRLVPLEPSLRKDAERCIEALFNEDGSLQAWKAAYLAPLDGEVTTKASVYKGAVRLPEKSPIPCY